MHICRLICPFLCKQEVRTWCVWCERRASSSIPTSGQWSTFPLSSSSSWCATLAAWSETAAVEYEKPGPSARPLLTWEQGKLAEKRVGMTENNVIVTGCLYHTCGSDFLSDTAKGRLRDRLNHQWSISKVQICKRCLSFSHRACWSFTKCVFTTKGAPIDRYRLLWADIVLNSLISGLYNNRSEKLWDLRIGVIKKWNKKWVNYKSKWGARSCSALYVISRIL